MHLVLRDIIPFSDILNGAISTGSFLCSLAALEIVEQSFLQDTVNQTGKLNVSTVYYYVFFSENDNQDRFQNQNQNTSDSDFPGLPGLISLICCSNIRMVKSELYTI